ncbi:MAG: L-2-hydroxyglutarate oxidase [Polyangiaceae bacterium]
MTVIDVVVVGGGIVGLATAWELLNHGVRHVVVVEKELDVGLHQSGHNSGVLHSGLYYAPGSIKAELARRGRERMVEFCESDGVPFEICGKVVVATDFSETSRLDELESRARKNGVDVERIGAERLRELEPAARGVSALHVKSTGIVDFRRVCAALSRRIVAHGGRILRGTELLSATEYLRATVVDTTRGPLTTRLVVSAAGLQADRVARCLGFRIKGRVVPFRGEYFLLDENGKKKVRGLIYPVPDPRFPFLGVHFTRRIGGEVDCGPNAVLSLGRESYEPGALHWEDAFDTLAYAGFHRFASKHYRSGLEELRRSRSKRAFTRALQRLVPSIEETDLLPAQAGIRAQIITPDGRIEHDFSIEESARRICVLSAPSPAATASLEIGRVIAERARRHLE